ncbi:hypothetical protein [Compostibacter hankyongensis]|uniref:Prevent-host-death protein n=1 Tax=Compostibacter hankyongensis TaxID=1007089 RepID=A0ABP8G973_9BACT
MSLQYISDQSGKHTAVVIPINDWKKMLNKHSDLKQLEKQSAKDHPVAKKYKMADFVGTISTEMAETLQKHVEQSRNEWQNSTF